MANIRNDGQISGYQELRSEEGREVKIDIRSHTKAWLKSILTMAINTQTYACDKLYSTKYTNAHTQMGTSEIGELWRRSADYINVNTLAMILHYRFAKCYHCGKQGKVCGESLYLLPPLFFKHSLYPDCSSNSPPGDHKSHALPTDTARPPAVFLTIACEFIIISIKIPIKELHWDLFCSSLNFCSN